MNRPFHQIICGRNTLLVVIVLSVVATARAEDLKTKSGRVYKNASIVRVEPNAWVIEHKFGVVRIPLSEVASESKRRFDPAKALEAARQQRLQQQQAAAARERERSESIREQKATARQAAVDVDEENQAEAEALEARIQRRRAEPREDRTPQRYRLRGEVIGVGPDAILVLCESGDEVSRARQELARLKDSPFRVQMSARQEVLAVTGLRKSLAEGESVDLPVQPAGTRRDFRTLSGDSYSGHFRVFRALE